MPSGLIGRTLAKLSRYRCQRLNLSAYRWLLAQSRQWIVSWMPDPVHVVMGLYDVLT